MEIYYSGAMGHPEQFAQRTFAEETERVTEGAAGWQDPPEIRLEKVQVMRPVALCAVSVLFFDAAAEASEAAAHSCWFTGCGA
jgi:hypothetical protein